MHLQVGLQNAPLKAYLKSLSQDTYKAGLTICNNIRYRANIHRGVDESKTTSSQREADEAAPTTQVEENTLEGVQQSPDGYSERQAFIRRQELTTATTHRDLSENEKAELDALNEEWDAYSEEEKSRIRQLAIGL